MRIFLACIAAMLLLASVAGAAGPSGVKDCRDCGTVRAVQALKDHQRDPGGGALGSAGALGASATGQNREPVIYRVIVQMDTGGTREALVHEVSDLSVGDKVRVSGSGNLERLEP